MSKLILSEYSLDEIVNAIKKVIDESNLAFQYIPEIQNNQEAVFLTRKETAELCRVNSMSTLWNWKQKGLLIPSSKAGIKPLYLKTDVLNFLKRRDSG